MKYFSPSYWFKMWLLSAPLFNDKTQGINAKSISNKSDIKNWASENTTGISVLEQQQLNYSNSTEFINYQTQLDTQPWNNNLNPVNIHKHRHEKNRNRHKRQNPTTPTITTLSIAFLIRSFWYNDSTQYLSNLNAIRDNLIRENILQTTTNTEVCIFDPNLPSETSHLIIMRLIEEENQNEEVKISLVLSARCFVVQGFILEHVGARHYFHFDNTHGDTYADNIPGVIPNNTYNLGFQGDYETLSGQNKMGNKPLPTNNISITESFNALHRLTNFNQYRNNRNNNIFTGESNNNIRSSLRTIIFVASESLRTRSIRDNVVKIIEGETINWQTVIRPVASSWKTKSKSADTSDILILHPDATGLDLENQPSTSGYNNQVRQESKLCVIESKKKDKKKPKTTTRRPKRSAADCLIVNSIAILEQDSSITDHFWRKHAKKSSMWIATNQGVYFRYQNGEYYPTPYKITNLNESIKYIDIDSSGNAYAIANSGNYYHIPIIELDAKNWNFSNNKVNAIKILREDSTNSALKTDSMWIATDQGVYYRNFEQWAPPEKIQNINESIKSISVDDQGSAYATADSGNYYYIPANNWSVKKINKPNDELRRFKKEIKNDKYVWDDNFTKNINDKKHLAPIFNNTNSNNSISKEQNIIDIKEINSILFSNQTDTNYVTNNNVTVGI